MSLPKKTPAPVTLRQSADEAFATILLHNFQYLKQYEPVAYKGESIRGVHQVRVSYRRMRSAVKNFRRALPRELTDPMAGEMKWFSRELGPARDLDVFLDEVLEPLSGKLEPSAGEAKLKELIQKERESAYNRVRSAIGSKRYRRFCHDFEIWVKESGWRKRASGKQKKVMDTPIKKYAAKELERRFVRFVAFGKKRQEMDDDQLHRLRIQGKEIRYACEFFTPIFGAQSIQSFVNKMKGVQSILGTVHDMAVMPEMLDRIAEKAQDDDVTAYIKAIVESRTSARDELMAQLERDWRSLAGARRPWKR
ncbi:MAG: CHAD domain-containing protein [Magnetococcales bacterium]|nr:CHAD domain-containing protein [Magnetococcales bacterium]